MFSGNVRFNTSLEYFVSRITYLSTSKTYFKYALEIKLVKGKLRRVQKACLHLQIFPIDLCCNKYELFIATHSFTNLIQKVWMISKMTIISKLEVKNSFVLRNLLGMFPEKMSKYSPLHCSAWFVQLMMGFHTFFGHITT